MHNQSNFPVAPTGVASGLATPVARRSFLRYTGASLAIGGLLLTSCSDDDDDVDPNSGLIDVGAGDTGILNYAYALEQLEAAFYAQVVAGDYFKNAATPNAEKQLFSDLRDHEAIHAAFFKAAIASGRISDSLKTDFSKIDFGSRASVLQAAMAFEDLGVAAYNGAGRFITDNNYLTLAGKIVSVEARHAAAIREVLETNSFVKDDVVELTGSNPRGTERSKRPPQVLETANQYLAAGSKLSAKSFA
jgi:rubrerythrin